jgi:hypothetical protein
MVQNQALGGKRKLDQLSGALCGIDRRFHVALDRLGRYHAAFRTSGSHSYSSLVQPDKSGLEQHPKAICSVTTFTEAQLPADRTG